MPKEAVVGRFVAKLAEEKQPAALIRPAAIVPHHRLPSRDHLDAHQGHLDNLAGSLGIT